MRVLGLVRAVIDDPSSPVITTPAALTRFARQVSRDLATLLISLCWREIGESSADSQSTFLTYLERDERDKHLDDGMPGKVRKIIDALREPALRFIIDKHWDPEQWHRQ